MAARPDALPDQLPAMLPDGWEVHEVCSDIDDDDVLHAGVDAARLPLRMGLLAGRRLSAAIGAGELARVDPDDWGSRTAARLESDTARQWAQATDPAPACDGLADTMTAEHGRRRTHARHGAPVGGRHGIAYGVAPRRAVALWTRTLNPTCPWTGRTSR